MAHTAWQPAAHVIYAGKAHSRDGDGRAMIQRIFAASKELETDLRIVYLADYDVALAKYLVAGAYLWLNTPRRPCEASGSSGIKAACNGVPSLSVLDGWWIEGYIEGVTGWSMPHGHTALPRAATTRLAKKPRQPAPPSD